MTLTRQDLEEATLIKVWDKAQDCDWAEKVYLADDFVLVARGTDRTTNDPDATITLEEVPLAFVVDKL